MIPEGDYTGKAIGIRFIKPKDKIAVEVSFLLKDNEGKEIKKTWQGYCTEAAQKHTLRQLVNHLDYDGDIEVEDVPDGHPKFGWLKNQNCINRNKEVSLQIKHNPSEDGTKMYDNIAWINALGGGQFAGASVQVVQSDLTALGWKASFLAMKAGKSEPKSETAKSFEKPFASTQTQQDIPF